MSEDYYKTLIKDIIENNDKEEAIKIIANKLNKKQMSNEKEILANIEKTIEIERLQNIIKEVREWLEEDYEYSKNNEICDRPRYYLDKFEEILDKGE